MHYLLNKLWSRTGWKVYAEWRKTVHIGNIGIHRGIYSAIVCTHAWEHTTIQNGRGVPCRCFEKQP